MTEALGHTPAGRARVGTADGSGHPQGVMHRLRATLWILWLCLLRLTWYSVPFLILAFLVLLLLFMLRPVTWQYTLSADTDVALIDLPDTRETNWRVGGAVLCLPRNEQLPAEASVIRIPDSPCGSWPAYRIKQDSRSASAGDLILTLGGTGTADHQGIIHALLEAQPNPGLMLALRADANASPKRIGVLHTVDDDVEIALTSKANLVWTGGTMPDATSVLVFPFQGELTAGRDVTWSYDRMLNSGRLSVYTASDQSAAKRKLVQEMDLMLGDQVRLKKAMRAHDTVWPRGHLRYVWSRSAAQGAPTLQVAGIGLAESLLIERFGGSEIEFRPGFWTRLINNRLAIFSGLMIGLLTVFSSYVQLANAFVDHEFKPQSLRALWEALRTVWKPRAPSGTCGK